jgi:hypothetical protein
MFSTIAASLIGLPLQYVFVLPQLEVNRSRYVVQSVLRGQWIGWIGGVLLLVGRDYLSAFDTWVGLILAAGVLGLVFYIPIWFVVVKKTHRDNVHAFIRHDLIAPLLRSR